MPVWERSRTRVRGSSVLVQVVLTAVVSGLYALGALLPFWFLTSPEAGAAFFPAGRADRERPPAVAASDVARWLLVIGRPSWSVDLTHGQSLGKAIGLLAGQHPRAAGRGDPRAVVERAMARHAARAAHRLPRLRGRARPDGRRRDRGHDRDAARQRSRLVDGGRQLVARGRARRLGRGDPDPRLVEALPLRAGHLDQPKPWRTPSSPRPSRWSRRCCGTTRCSTPCCPCSSGPPSAAGSAP